MSRQITKLRVVNLTGHHMDTMVYDAETGDSLPVCGIELEPMDVSNMFQPRLKLTFPRTQLDFVTTHFEVYVEKEKV